MAGAESSTSSLTSTSHTLTQAPAMALIPHAQDEPTVLSFLDILKPNNRHTFLQPSPSLPAASLQFAKETLDAFAGQVSDEQQERLKEARQKRKRGGDDMTAEQVLKIRKLHVDGFDTAQVWQQARRIISSTLLQSKKLLKELEDANEVSTENPELNGNAKVLEFGKDGFELASDDEDESSTGSGNTFTSSDEEGEQGESEDGEVSDEDLENGAVGSEQSGDENDDDIADMQGDEDEESENEDEEANVSQSNGIFVEDPNGLNDGFFSIDEFNKQTQWLEDQDFRANPKTDQLSDEELDWHANPMSTSLPKQRKPSKTVEDDAELESDGEVFGELDDNDDDEEDEDDGPPAFADVDLFAPEGESGDEVGPSLEDGLTADFTANDIFYKDFFAPPPKKGKNGSKTGCPYHERKPIKPDDSEVERAMADVRRDLFDDSNSDGSGSEDALSEVDAGDPQARKAPHERLQAKLLGEIRKLEAAAVREKEWTMSGEAAGSSRPMNSILEEDLDFEHAGKPIPVITQEVSESIEEMVKRRIIDQTFDEVIRRLPTAIDGETSKRRGLAEINDDKGSQSLAQIYEEEHVKANNPDSYVSKSDEKIRAEEKEIEGMWRDVCGRLDALSSWHFKPKPAAPTLTVVSDIATIAMEDAQPTTAQGVSGGQSMLAPQELFKAGKETAEKGELVAKSGLPVARQEMSREDRRRRHRRSKERIKKSEATNNKPLSKKAQEKQGTMADLKKGGVKVINRKGEIVDMDGNKAGATRAVTSSSFKL